MKKTLVIIGLLFFIQIGLASYMFHAKIDEPPEPTETFQFRQYLAEIRTWNWIGCIVGSVVGCLGSWMLALYLKVCELEKKIAKLQQNEQAER